MKLSSAHCLPDLPKGFVIELLLKMTPLLDSPFSQVLVVHSNNTSEFSLDVLYHTVQVQHHRPMQQPTDGVTGVRVGVGLPLDRKDGVRSRTIMHHVSNQFKCQGSEDRHIPPARDAKVP